MRRAAAALALAFAALTAVPAGTVAASSRAVLAPIQRPSTAATAASKATGLDIADRWIVVLKDGTDVGRAAGRARGLGASPEHTFAHAVHGYAAKLDAGQLDAVRRDPDVAMVVADDVVSIQGQTVPTGVERISGLRSPIAKIDGVDERVDADVAIVDTGIDRTHPDLNVVGGINCSTTNPNAWWDSNGHGTHVAGTVGALDNGIGVVGVAPGVRLWAVRILDSAGNGLLSWYVCGLDWIAAQHDPLDATRPLFEAVNMSVAKPGSDDRACGAVNADILHAAICRLVATGVTVVAAAGNNSFNASRLVPASYDEVITVSALADTDGQPGGHGGHACYSWGSYDTDDTFANFSNYGADVDLIAPGKCIRSTLPNNSYGYLSGTSMAAPLVTGAVALYMSSRPLATPADVKAALQAMGNLGWNTATDPDTRHEPLLDVSRIVPLGDYALAATVPDDFLPWPGMSFEVPIDVIRAEDFTDTVDVSVDVPDGLIGIVDPSDLAGDGSAAATLTVTIPADAPTGDYPITIHGRAGDRDRTTDLVIAVAPVPTSRLSGADRFATAAAISKASFPAGVAVAYIANGLNFPDALAGAAAAGAAKAPVLLVRPDAIPSSIATELARLHPGRIVVLGGTSAVSDAVKTALATYTAGGVTRLAGADRFATAAAISKASFPAGVGVAYIANGLNFPDALAGAAAAGAAKAPVLLVRPDAIPSSIATELARLHPGRIVVLGGTSAVSDAVKTALATYTAGGVTRLAGADRFATAAAISKASFPAGVGVAYIANGLNFPDALAGAAVAGAQGGPVLLVTRDAVPSPIASELDRLNPGRIVVLGGTGVVSDATTAAARAAALP